MSPLTSDSMALNVNYFSLEVGFTSMELSNYAKLKIKIFNISSNGNLEIMDN